MTGKKKGPDLPVIHKWTIVYIEFLIDQIRVQVADPDKQSAMMTPLQGTLDILNDALLVEGLDGDNGITIQ